MRFIYSDFNFEISFKVRNVLKELISASSRIQTESEIQSAPCHLCWRCLIEYSSVQNNGLTSVVQNICNLILCSPSLHIQHDIPYTWWQKAGSVTPEPGSRIGINKRSHLYRSHDHITCVCIRGHWSDSATSQCHPGDISETSALL